MPDGCWDWKGPMSRNGYGTFSVRYQKYRAHRWSYEAFVGSIPDGYVIDHLCKNTVCVNPEHLEAVTPRENLLRGDSPAATAARRETCINGHPWTPENTRINKKGSRECRTCDREYQRKKHGHVPMEEYRNKTHCKNGHEYNEENTHVGVDGWRRCRVCQREAFRRRRGIPPEKQRGSYKRSRRLDDGTKV